MAEGHPEHARHVQEFIDYANTLADANSEELHTFVATELPNIVDKQVDKKLQEPNVRVKVDEGSFRAAKRKIESLFSIFK